MRDSARQPAESYNIIRNNSPLPSNSPFEYRLQKHVLYAFGSDIPQLCAMDWLPSSSQENKGNSTASWNEQASSSPW